MQWRDKKTVILFLEEITICFPEVLCQAIFVGLVHSGKKFKFTLICYELFNFLSKSSRGNRGTRFS